MEIWKDIEGYEGLYQVSNLGRVKSLGNDRNRKEKIRRPVKQRDGYLLIDLWKNGKIKAYTVHRLVAQTFIPNPDNKPCINHLNEDKTDNRVENLEWCTVKENINYGTHNLRVAKTLTNGKRSKPVRCVETNIIYPSISEVERQLGYNIANIGKCCKGKVKTSYGYHWQYYDPNKKEVVTEQELPLFYFN